MCVQCMYPINRIYLMFINALRKMYMPSNDYYSYTWINTPAGEFYTAQYKYIMCVRIIILGFFSSAIIRFRSWENMRADLSLPHRCTYNTHTPLNNI